MSQRVRYLCPNMKCIHNATCELELLNRKSRMHLIKGYCIHEPYVVATVTTKVNLGHTDVVHQPQLELVRPKKKMPGVLTLSPTSRPARSKVTSYWVCIGCAYRCNSCMPRDGFNSKSAIKTDLTTHRLYTELN